MSTNYFAPNLNYASRKAIGLDLIQWNLDLVNHQIVNFREIVNFLRVTNFLVNRSLELVNFSKIIKILFSQSKFVDFQ